MPPAAPSPPCTRASRRCARRRHRYDAAMTRMIRRSLPALLLAFVAVLLAACGASVGGTKKTDAMTEYSAAVRWNEFDSAWAFVDPEVRAERPLSDLERERFRQVQVTGYNELSRSMSPDG